MFAAFKALRRRLKAMFAGEAPAHRRAIAGELMADTSSSVKVADSIRVEFMTQREWVARRIQIWMCTPEEAEEDWKSGSGASAPHKEGGRRGMTLPPTTSMSVGRESKCSVASVVGLLGPTDERLALESVGTHACKTHPSNPVFAGLGSGAWAPGAAGSSAAPTDASLAAGALSLPSVAERNEKSFRSSTGCCCGCLPTRRKCPRPSQSRQPAISASAPGQLRRGPPAIPGAHALQAGGSGAPGRQSGAAV